MRPLVALASLVAAYSGGCSGPSRTGTVAPSPQPPGDPTAGYHALVNNGYITCGIPYSAFSKVMGPAPQAERLPGRDGKNADLAYGYTVFTAASGVELVSANCLTCHAGHILGQLVVGLGAADADFTTSQAGLVHAAGLLVFDPIERTEWQKFADRVDTIAPYSVELTRGANPADNFTATLLAHHDAKTLAWSKDPLMTVPPVQVLPVDVPPWWRMKKKNAMFYIAAGRGNHSRIEMTASTLCTDSVDEARSIASYFPDIAAYIRSIEPPRFPLPIDPTLSARGERVFAQTCARCHGSYGTESSYPNLVVSLAEIGTDPSVATGATQFSGPFIDWYRRSFYGEGTDLEPAQGYIAPPLDGVWATAPYLHNGSVPTLAALLDSSKRPAFWTRSFDSNDYDPAALGWNFTVVDHGQAAEPNAQTRALLYDTTQLGYGNGGHTFGDGLSADDRRAVIEYLKTL